MFLPRTARRLGPKWTSQYKYAAGAAVSATAVAAIVQCSPSDDVLSGSMRDDESALKSSERMLSSKIVAPRLPRPQVLATSITNSSSSTAGSLSSFSENHIDLTYGFMDDLLAARKSYMGEKKIRQIQLEEKNGQDQDRTIGDDLNKKFLAPTANNAVMLASSAMNDNKVSNNTVSTKKMYIYSNNTLEPEMADKLKLFCTPSSTALAEDVAQLLGVSLGDIRIGKYADGETSLKINDTIRGKQIYFICSTASVDALMELMLSVSCCNRASANRITVVIPYYGYSRQDRKVKRETIAAADVARMLEAVGVNSVIAMDLHNDSIRGFFSPRVPVDHLMPGPIAAAYFNEVLAPASKPENQITIVATHEGQVQRATEFRKVLQKLSGAHVNMAFISKSRQLASQTSYDPILVGDIKGHRCILIDDIISTGSTLTNAINLLKDNGADEVYAYATHALFSDENTNVPEKLQALDALDFLLISNTVSSSKTLPTKIRTLTVAPLLAEAISRSLHNESITEILKGLFK